MTVSILRTADAWWVQNPTGPAQVTSTATTTRELLADRGAIEAAAHSSDTVPVDSLQLLSPITTPCRVVAQTDQLRLPCQRRRMGPGNHPTGLLPQGIP